MDKFCKVINNGKGKNLVIIFQGLYTKKFKENFDKYGFDINKYDDIPFMAYNSLHDVKEYNFIFVRDPYQLWYINMVGILKHYLKEQIILMKPKKIITFGSSSGGFAAILFGHLLKVNKILAYCPQSYAFSRVMTEDRILMKKKFIKEKMMIFSDLTKLGKLNCKEILIFICRFNIEDKQHANNIAKYDNVKILEYECDGHGNNLFKEIYGENFKNNIIKYFT